MTPRIQRWETKPGLVPGLLRVKSPQGSTRTRRWSRRRSLPAILPGIKDGRFDAQLIADLGHGCALQKVSLESGHFLGDRKVTTRLLGYGKVPPFRLC